MQIKTLGLLCSLKRSAMLLAVATRRLFTPGLLWISIGLLNRPISILGLPKNDAICFVVVFAFVTAHYL